jgi:hypothetical protein
MAEHDGYGCVAGPVGEGAQRDAVGGGESERGDTGSEVRV